MDPVSQVEVNRAGKAAGLRLGNAGDPDTWTGVHSPPLTLFSFSPLSYSSVVGFGGHLSGTEGASCLPASPGVGE